MANNKPDNNSRNKLKASSANVRARAHTHTPSRTYKKEVKTKEALARPTREIQLCGDDLEQILTEEFQRYIYK